MAEVQANDHGGDGKKNKQKKQTLRVDFTPMVDMNMLLITFFMFCTTLLKPQTMKIAFPTKDEVKDESMENKVAESTAVTLLLGDNNEIYYYEGYIKEENYENYNEFLNKTGWAAQGEASESIRQYLYAKNKGAYDQIEELRKRMKAKEISEEDFNAQVKIIQEEAKKAKKAPTVMIKPTDLASYENMVDALDEMLICDIASYAIMDLDKGDRIILSKKTNNPEYLTEEERKDPKLNK
ncbi:MAG: biopolymer transporter ExbD [Dysgonamonadaceae bacterium]|jgi:biopolymer transport protein ExbD|nr:biopolymer transporter ExbD [Dysgonamonadaceae bacterium]